MTDNYKNIYKVVLLGDSGVGKTNILSRYTNDEFLYESKSTIGVEFYIVSMNINGNNIKLQLWDTAGQERFRSLTKAYYRGANCVIIVYDITNKKSFDNLIYWFDIIEQCVDCKSTLCIIGNKSDLINNRQVPIHMAQSFAETKKALFMEVSAFSNYNITELFDTIALNMVQEEQLNDINKDINIESSKIICPSTPVNVVTKKKCCNS